MINSTIDKSIIFNKNKKKFPLRSRHVALLIKYNLYNLKYVILYFDVIFYNYEFEL